MLVVWSANGDGSDFTSKASSKVNLRRYLPMGLSDRNFVILQTNRATAHYIKKSLVYSMRKVFLEGAVVELVYKFGGEKSTRSV